MRPPLTTTRLSYRPALDGVRAVAVLLVFVFHAVPSALPGGFLGVDVFFVLSGYLITRLLVEEFEVDGSIVLRRFYARRSRRLVPAVALFVLAVGVVESVWGSVLTAASRVREAVATLFYVANWNLIVTADDYFAEGDSSPMRHAWSLAVEEQFYLVWPALLLLTLMLARRAGVTSRRPLLVVTVVLTLVSVTAMLVTYDPSNVARTYYGTDTRIFQPLVGAVLGILSAGRPSPAGRTRQWSTVAALALGGILVMSFTVEGSGAFYYRGGALLAAVLAVVLVLALERSTDGWLTRLLSTPPIVGLGVISYGFYLWHWPILGWLDDPAGSSFVERRLVNLLQFALTVAVAVASHRLVEDPIRSSSVPGMRSLKPLGTVFAGVVVLAVTAGAVATVIDPVSDAELEQLAAEAVEPAPVGGDSVSAGAGDAGQDEAVLEPLSKEAREAIAVAATKDRSFHPCPDAPHPCAKVDAGPDAPVVALVGDSTAQAYDPALEELALANGFTYVQAALGGCPIGHRLLATGIDGERHKPSNIECFDWFPGVYEELLEVWDPDIIVATSRNEVSQHVSGDVVLRTGTPEHLEETESALVDALDLLQSSGAAVVFVDLLPLPLGPTVDCLSVAQPWEPECSTSAAGGAEVPYNEIMGALAEGRDGVERITLTDVLCPGTTCPLMIDGVVVRYDGIHLTDTMSRSIAPVIAERMAAVGVPLPVS